MNKKRLIRTFSIIAIGLIIGGLSTYFQIKSESSGSIATIKHTPVVASDFGGEFTLTNHLGETVTDKDFKDQYRLIYFGFTYCPAICPTELQKITMALKDLDPVIADQITPIFVTIDPERDTAEKMKNYISLFHENFIGLTGTPEQTKQIADAYKIYYARVKDDTMQEYTMDHSSFIYFMGPEDTLYHIFKVDDKAEAITYVVARHFTQ